MLHLEDISIISHDMSDVFLIFIFCMVLHSSSLT